MDDRMQQRAWSLAAAMLATALLAPGSVAADATVSGTVTTNADPAGPVAGAFVAVTGAAAQRATVADEHGQWTLPAVPTGTYRVAVHAPGYTAAVDTGVAVAAEPIVADVVLASSDAKFRALGVYGGQIATVVADGRSGVFYASTSVIPQVYRTADYGGTWTPVTLAIDDPTQGLAATGVGAGLTSSGFPGELAVEVSGAVWYSTDFGTTWRSLAVPPLGTPPGPGARLHWGHVGDTNVLLLVAGTTTLRANMSAATPAFVVQTPGYLASDADRLTVANGADGAWVAVARADGALDVYDLGDLSLTDRSSEAGFPAPPTFVRLGGAHATPGVPPDAVLVYSFTASAVEMALKSGAGDFVTRRSTTSFPGCGTQAGSIGAIGPQSGGDIGIATLSQCLVVMDVNAITQITVSDIHGINNNTGLAFDAGYDGVGNRVIVAGDGGRGLVKSAGAAGGVPLFPSNQEASAGTAAGSGGVAVHGFDVAVVKDVAYGPSADGSQIATALSGSGGALGVASADAGDSFVTVVRKGGRAVAWWDGAAGPWLVYGHGGAGDLLTAVQGWTPATPALAGPNVPASAAGTLGGGPDFDVSALAPVPGDDVVFVGGGSQLDQSGATGSVVRVALGAGPVLEGIVPIGVGTIAHAVRALAYCPEGSEASLADVLLVATGTAGGGAAGGSVVRVTGATGDSPEATVVESMPATVPVNDLRAHCASGTVVAGIGSNGTAPDGPLWTSTDGGASFAPVAIAGAGLPPTFDVRVVAIDPSDAAHLLIAGNGEGFIAETTDGGTTWTAVNAPNAPGGRNFSSEGVGDLELPAAAPPALVAADTSGTALALVGTGGGLFAADFTRTGDGGGGGGGGGDACTADAQCDDGDPCTIDACAGGACSATPITGIAGAGCELDRLDPALCPDGSVDPVLARALGKTARKVDGLLDKANASTKAKKQAKLLKRADKALAALAKKVGKSRTASSACKSALATQIEAIRART